MKKILLIGDSIRCGYDTHKKMAFENSAEVYFPKDNCRFTGYIIRHLQDWKNELKLGNDVDLVHLNNAPVEYHSDLTHYYTKEGTKLITNQVVNCIENVLDIKGKAS